MGAIGPVTLREVRDVLSERLRTVAVEPPDSRYGRVFVGTTEQARGRVFRVVFVPGLAERVFPQKLREDPLLADAVRSEVDAGLPHHGQPRVARSACCSGSRSAPRPSARTSRIPRDRAARGAPARAVVLRPRRLARDHRPRPRARGAAGAGRARDEDDARVARAASIPARAVDDVEHDLAVLAPLLRAQDQLSVKGHAHYLLGLNDHLRRSLTERWQRWKPAWTPSDGLVKATDVVRAALEDQRLAQRPYSLTALQRYAACPYQFLLQAIYRLEPFEEPTPLQRLDPLTKGGLFHAIQAAFFRERQKERRAAHHARQPRGEPRGARRARCRRSRSSERELLAPAVDRVWRDEIAAIRKDLRRWVDAAGR